MNGGNKKSLITSIIMYLIVAAIVAGCLLLIFGNKTKKTMLTYQEFYNQVKEFPDRMKSVNAKPSTGNNYMLYYVSGVYTTSEGKETNYYVYISQEVFDNTNFVTDPNAIKPIQQYYMKTQLLLLNILKQVIQMFYQ